MQLLAAAAFNGYALGFGKGKIFTGQTKLFCVPVLNCYSCPGALGACPIGSLQAALGNGKNRFPFCNPRVPSREGREEDHQHQQNDVFDIPRGLVDFFRNGQLRHRDFMQQVLHQSEGAQQPAHRPSQHYALANPGLRQAAGWLLGWKSLVLLAILALSAVIHRPFCKYVCPLGAIPSAPRPGPGRAVPSRRQTRKTPPRRGRRFCTCRIGCTPGC